MAETSSMIPTSDPAPLVTYDKKRHLCAGTAGL
jgi:hypothetical protein